MATSVLKGQMQQLSAELKSIKRALVSSTSQSRRTEPPKEKKKERKKRGKGTRKTLGKGGNDLGMCLLGDHLRHTVLPSRTYFGEYQASERFLTFVPFAGAYDNTNGFTLVGNPWYAWVNQIVYDTLDAATYPSHIGIPTWMQSGTGTQFIPTPNQGTGSSDYYWTNQVIQNTVTTGQGIAEAYSGWIRVHGVEVDVEYTGKVLDCGGTVTVLHGGGSGSGLLTQSPTLSWEATYPNISVASGDLDRVNQFRFSRRLKFVWRPHSLDFAPVRSYRESVLLQQSATAMVVESGEAEMSDVLAGGADVQEIMATPYSFGLNIRLAASAAAGTSLPLIVRLRIITDEMITAGRFMSQDVSRRISVPSHRSLADTAKMDKIHNQLSAVHQARKRPVQNIENPYSFLKGVGKNVLESAAASAGEKMLASIF